MSSNPVPPLPFTAGAAMLSRLWRMRGEDTPHLSDQGDELDIEAFTAAQVSRDPRVFCDPRRSNRGESVIMHLLIDVSGSMETRFEPRKENAINTAVMAAQSAVSAGIVVHAATFGDYLKRFPVLRSLQDVALMKDRLTRMNWDGTTPTVEALALVYQDSIATPNASHVCIVVTDGQPDPLPEYLFHKYGKPSKKDVQGLWAARAMVEAMAEAGIEVFGFMVSSERRLAGCVRDCFGPDRSSVADSDHEAALGLARVVERFL